MNGHERVLRQELARHGIVPLPWATVIDLLDTLQEIHNPTKHMKRGKQ